MERRLREGKKREAEKEMYQERQRERVVRHRGNIGYRKRAKNWRETHESVADAQWRTERVGNQKQTQELG